MTREQAKELIPILQAYAEGKTIQNKFGDKWCDNTDPNFVGFDVRLYRIKPENTYRPFMDSAELILEWNKKTGIETNSMQEPLIWVKHKVDDRRRLITCFGENSFGDKFVELGNKAKPVTMQSLFEMYEFLDGTPCGAKND